MKRVRPGRAIGLSAVLLFLSAGAASAQTAGARNQPRYGFGSDQPNPPITRVLPPRQPTSLPGALLDQDLQTMRAGSLYPDKFLYGQYNPRVETFYPPTYGFQPGHGYGGGYSGGFYGGGFYGNVGYGNFQGGFGFGYNPYPQVIQREVYVLRDRYTDYGGQGSQQAPQRRAEPRREEPRREERPKNDGDFYLRNPAAAESISDALDDLRKAWLNGDFERFQARIKTTGEVKILLNGEFKYALRGSEFATIVKDAMTKIDTVAFEFDRPKAEGSGRASVTGKHTFINPAKEKQEVAISYALERMDGKWKVVEAGSSDRPGAK